MDSTVAGTNTNSGPVRDPTEIIGLTVSLRWGGGFKRISTIVQEVIYVEPASALSFIVLFFSLFSNLLDLNRLVDERNT